MCVFLDKVRRFRKFVESIPLLPHVMYTEFLYIKDDMGQHKQETKVNGSKIFWGWADVFFCGKNGEQNDVVLSPLIYDFGFTLKRSKSQRLKLKFLLFLYWTPLQHLYMGFKLYKLQWAISPWHLALSLWLHISSIYTDIPVLDY